MELILSMTFENKMLRIMEQLVSKILAFYIPSIMEQYGALVRIYFNKLDVLIDSRGLAFTVRYVKTSRNCVTRYICGEPLNTCDGVRLTKSGWPFWLSDFEDLTQTRDGCRLLMTLLCVLRGVHLPPSLDLKPITDPWSGTDSITEKELGHACRRLGIRSHTVEWSRFHMSTKSGPIGQAILMSLTELSLLPLSLLMDIKLIGGESLCKVIDMLNNKSLGGYSVVDIWSKLYPARSNSLRKITYFSDKEGKTRVIAILDYWSQTALRPLHDTLNRILSRIRSDCTFNQNHFHKCLPLDGPYYSLDLSNATDRMPLLVQKRVISRVIGIDKAEAWARLLVGTRYTLRGYHGTVSYGSGQPMGAYSSWCAMALTHHVLVHVSALRAGYPHFWDYALLGDDLVIANAAVATEYRKLLDQLDMPISPVKTHVSKDTYEFAKRWIHNREEITGFAISGLKSVWKKYPLLRNFLETQSHHGWSLLPDKHPDLISSIYQVYGRFEQSKRVIKLYMVFDSLANAKMTGNYLLLLTTLTEYFPTHLSSEQLLTYVPTDLTSRGKTLVIKAKKKLTERDLETFQKDAYIVNDRLNRELAENFPSLSGQDYRALLREYSPIVKVLNELIDKSMNSLLMVFNDSPETEEFYLSLGLSKYHVSRGIFTMRASHSIALADSMVVKAILDLLRENQGDLDAISTR